MTARQIVTCASVFATCATAGEKVQLAWDPNTESDLAYYTLYWWSGSTGLTNRLTVAAPATTATVTNLPAGCTIYFVVTASNRSGLESGPSNLVSYTTAPDLTEVTLNLAVSRSGFSFNRLTRRFQQTLTVTNLAGFPVAGPVVLVLEGLSSNATLVNRSGVSSFAGLVGAPYLELKLGSDGLLTPEESVSTPLEFSNSNNLGINYIVHVLGIPLLPPPPAGPRDVTAEVAVLPSGFNYNRFTKRFVQAVTLINTTAHPLPAPVSLGLAGLSANATLANPTGVLTVPGLAGGPYINFNLLTDQALAEGQSIVVTLEFVNPTYQGITYQTHILTGPGDR